MFYVLFYANFCQFQFCNHLNGEERGGCVSKFVFLLSRDCCVALPCGTMGLSAVCECGISLQYSLTIFDAPFFSKMFIAYIGYKQVYEMAVDEYDILRILHQNIISLLKIQG